MYELTDPKFRPVLDHGFCYLVDTMGDDAAICQAARISYGVGTKTVREDRNLIRYLFRHAHTSPIEQAEVKLHLRIPIFVARQLIRHRTANSNEYSARYSILSDDFYVPDTDNIQPQSSHNKQGRYGSLSKTSSNGVQRYIESVSEHAYEVYRVLLGEREDRDPLPTDPLLDDDFAGVARELARVVLPVNYYTELYWKQDLYNLLHLLHLRCDPHAQYEIRVLANAIYDLIKPVYPVTCEAWQDYRRDAVTLSRMEVNLVCDLLADFDLTIIDPAQYGLSQRELREFLERFGSHNGTTPRDKCSQTKG